MDYGGEEFSGAGIARCSLVIDDIGWCGGRVHNAHNNRSGRKAAHALREKFPFFSENSKWGAPPNPQQLATLLLLVVTLTAPVTFCNTSSTEKKQIQRTIN